MVVHTDGNTIFICIERAKEKADMWKIFFHLSHFLKKFVTRELPYNKKHIFITYRLCH